MPMNGIRAEEKLTKIAGESGPASPKHKVKFLCSYGGKILPRPFDNHLKYVGGETRVISVSHDSSFSGIHHPHCLPEYTPYCRMHVNKDRK